MGFEQEAAVLDEVLVKVSQTFQEKAQDVFDELKNKKINQEIAPQNPAPKTKIQNPRIMNERDKEKYYAAILHNTLTKKVNFDLGEAERKVADFMRLKGESESYIDTFKQKYQQYYLGQDARKNNKIKY